MSRKKIIYRSYFIYDSLHFKHLSTMDELWSTYIFEIRIAPANAFTIYELNHCFSKLSSVLSVLVSFSMPISRTSTVLLITFRVKLNSSFIFIKKITESLSIFMYFRLSASTETKSPMSAANLSTASRICDRLSSWLWKSATDILITAFRFELIAFHHRTSFILHAWQINFGKSVEPFSMLTFNASRYLLKILSFHTEDVYVIFLQLIHKADI